jgi:hypothetical protein
LAELKQAAELILNQTVHINTIPLLETKDSSGIGNIVSTTDGVFRYAHSHAGSREAAQASSALPNRPAAWLPVAEETAALYSDGSEALREVDDRGDGYRANAAHAADHTIAQPKGDRPSLDKGDHTILGLQITEATLHFARRWPSVTLAEEALQLNRDHSHVRSIFFSRHRHVFVDAVEPQQYRRNRQHCEHGLRHDSNRVALCKRGSDQSLIKDDNRTQGWRNKRICHCPDEQHEISGRCGSFWVYMDMGQQKHIVQFHQ